MFEKKKMCLAQFLIHSKSFQTIMGHLNIVTAKQDSSTTAAMTSDTVVA